MYRNIIHKCGPETNWASIIHLFTWNEDGVPVDYEIPYKPHLYYVPYEDSEACKDYTTVTGKPLVKKEFRNIFERRKWLDKNPKVKVYDCWSPEMAFLHDNFSTMCEDKDFAKYPLKVYAFDIETTVGQKFPDVDNPTEVITCLTFADVRTYESWTWLLLTDPWKKNLTEKNFKNKGTRKYFVFKSEREMYIHFLKWFSENRPDIITGWNIDSFDIPFIINRFSLILSPEEVAQALSPTGQVRKIFVKHNVKSRPYVSYRMEGITVLDYMQMYRDKFCSNAMVPDFKLDTICMEELGVGKLEYDCSFKEFYENDFEKFIEYNIIDVIRVCDLEKKLKLIALTRYMCNTSLIQYEKIMAVQPVVIGALEILMRNKGQLIMTDDRVDPELKTHPFEGAYVFSRNEYKSGPFASFDLNSLYPNIIMTINISPETFVGRISGYETSEWTVTIDGKSKVMTREQFAKRFADKLNVAPNGSMFLKRKYRIGMCAQFEDKFYKGRKVIKKEMLEAERKAAAILKDILEKEPNFKYSDPMVKLDTPEKEEWARWNDEATFKQIAQLSAKLNLNSLYGLFTSKFSPICSMDCGAAITKAGQYIIRSSMKFLNDEMDRIKAGGEI